MSEVSILSSGIAESVASSRSCRGVNDWARALILVVDFLVAFGINPPFAASCFSGRNNPYCAVLVVCGVRDEEYIVRSDHADRLPAWFAIDLAVLGGYMVRVVEYV
jgi:hypothetical protein